MGRRQTPKDDDTSIAAVQRGAREMLVECLTGVKRQLEQVQSHIASLYNKQIVDMRSIKDATVVEGILVDKTKDILRSVTELETATRDELEAYFEIYEKDPKTGKKRRVK